MPNPNDPTIKDMENFYEHIKTWHKLVNKKLDEGNQTNLYIIHNLEKEIDYSRFVY